MCYFFLKQLNKILFDWLNIEIDCILYLIIRVHGDLIYGFMEDKEVDDIILNEGCLCDLGDCFGKVCNCIICFMLILLYLIRVRWCLLEYHELIKGDIDRVNEHRFFSCFWKLWIEKRFDFAIIREYIFKFVG